MISLHHKYKCVSISTSASFISQPLSCYVMLYYISCVCSFLLLRLIIIIIILRLSFSVHQVEVAIRDNAQRLYVSELNSVGRGESLPMVAFACILYLSE